MLKLYRDHPLVHSLIFIGCYCVFMSIGDAASAAAGIAGIVTFPISLLLCAVLLTFLIRHNLTDELGLRRPCVPPHRVLFYFPLAVMISVNAWYGISMRYTVTESILQTLCMLAVGLLEELIFRGLLYRALCRENEHAAVIVSSVTFGMGHIINLLNGSAESVFSCLLQIVYAAAAGFLFVILLRRTASLYPAIITHSLLNALSVFSSDHVQTTAQQLFSASALTLLSCAYAVYLLYCLPPCPNNSNNVQ